MSLRVDLYEGARIAVGSLRSNRMRTVLTTLGIGIGVATLLAIVGIIQGLNASFDEQLKSIGSTYLQVSKYPWGISGNWWEYRNRKKLTLELVDTIQRQSRYATAVAPTVWRMSDIAFLGEQVANVDVMGTTLAYQSIGGIQIARGRFLNEIDDASQKRVVVLGADVTDGLFRGIDPIGKTVLIDKRPYTVIGTLERKGRLLDENLDLTAYIPFKTHRADMGRWRDIQIAVAIADTTRIAAAEDELVGILRRARGTPPDKPDDFAINRTDKLMETYNKLTGALYGVAVGIGFITLLVGGIGIMNIMLVSVRERTREIGIRRALGARKRTIIAQFLMEAAAVSAFGGTLGTLVGLGAAKVVSEITPLAASVQPLTIVFGIGFSSLVGLIFGIWPAARAANLDPVEALRYE
ncbi:MAG: ABC transporter permease [Myxococcaceae bacterium]|nr:ABC transporter permease [Myxococcaceae bacterium]